MRVLQSSGGNCGNYNSCTKCVEQKTCSWCDETTGVESGPCQVLNGCSNSVTQESQCPSASTDTMMTNISGLIVAMLGIVICLNVLNRCSNKRRRQIRKKSIFRLPVYKYPSREQRAETLGEARSILNGPPDLAIDVDVEKVENGSLHGEENCAVTCTICLSPYQNEELIKVLPCGHEFHAECLDCWLERKANCPLCKAHAFSKTDRGDSWSNTSRSQQVRALIPPVRNVASGLVCSLTLSSSTSRSTHERTDDGCQNPTGDTALVRSMSPRTERGAVYNATEEAAFENGSEPTHQEVPREETKTARDYNEGSAKVACAGDCDRDTIDGDNRFDVTFAENRMGTRGAPQPPLSGAEGNQNTGKRFLLVENDRNTPDDANALGEAGDLGNPGVGKHVTELVTTDITTEPTSTREVALEA